MPVDQQNRTARLVTEITSPTIYGPALLVIVAAADIPQHGSIALLWGAVAGIFTGGLPLLFLRIGARRGRWDSHHVSEREHRQVPFLFAIVSVAVGIGILYTGHAPRDLAALVVAMLAGLAAMLAINQVWKISVHAGAAAGAAVILLYVFGIVGAVIGAAVAIAAAWSRLAVRAHSAAQVVIGACVGALVAAVVFGILR